MSRSNIDLCPNCHHASLQYVIALDLYTCKRCKADFDTLEVENDHVLYHGYNRSEPVSE